MEIKNIKNQQKEAFLLNLEKAYTEGIYADTPANRKLGRVGMSYKEWTQKQAGGGGNSENGGDDKFSRVGKENKKEEKKGEIKREIKEENKESLNKIEQYNKENKEENNQIEKEKQGQKIEFKKGKVPNFSSLEDVYKFFNVDENNIDENKDYKIKLPWGNLVLSCCERENNKVTELTLRVDNVPKFLRFSRGDTPFETILEKKYKSPIDYQTKTYGYFGGSEEEQKEAQRIYEDPKQNPILKKEDKIKEFSDQIKVLNDKFNKKFEGKTMEDFKIMSSSEISKASKSFKNDIQKQYDIFKNSVEDIFSEDVKLPFKDDLRYRININGPLQEETEDFIEKELGFRLLAGNGSTAGPFQKSYLNRSITSPSPLYALVGKGLRKIREDKKLFNSLYKKNPDDIKKARNIYFNAIKESLDSLKKSKDFENFKNLNEEATKTIKDLKDSLENISTISYITENKNSLFPSGNLVSSQRGKVNENSLLPLWSLVSFNYPENAHNLLPY